jgi:phosphoenolpyruvate carboxykinase (GTP)
MENKLLDSTFFNPEVLYWINNWKNIFLPKDTVLCTGEIDQHKSLCNQMINEGRMIKLNEQLYQDCYLCRSDPSDVARTEDRTFICSVNKEDAGITNNWMSPDLARETLDPLLKGSMKGRTMYVIPFCMGNPKSPIAQYGIQLTDSLYVAISMKSMTRIVDLSTIDYNNFVKCIHTVGAPLMDDKSDVAWPCNKIKYICHFPEDLEIISHGSGYGGNSLLGKKCLALRIASVLGKKQGWLAEHMLILKLTNPHNESIFITAAFPSACGKTNLAMLQSHIEGWKIECVGDDIAWMYVNKDDGRLYAINPENGFFGVVPGTSDETNPAVMRMVKKNTIFTNVGLTPNLDVWWEGKTLTSPPDQTIRWDGSVYNESDNNARSIKIAHPNSRFTIACIDSDVLAKEFFDPKGVPISAIMFGGRRCDTIPLVSEAENWNRGVLFGSTLSSETTAAATGSVGIIRNDPFAILPFCGYNMRDYFHHWLDIGEKVNSVKFYMVNWFKKDSKGQFIWPGFGKNIYVLKWIFERCTISHKNTNNVTHTIKTQFGTSPIFDQNLLDEIYENNVPFETNKLFTVDDTEYYNEKIRIKQYLEKFDNLRLLEFVE